MHKRLTWLLAAVVAALVIFLTGGAAAQTGAMEGMPISQDEAQWLVSSFEEISDLPGADLGSARRFLLAEGIVSYAIPFANGDAVLVLERGRHSVVVLEATDPNAILRIAVESISPPNEAATKNNPEGLRWPRLRCWVEARRDSRRHFFPFLRCQSKF